LFEDLTYDLRVADYDSVDARELTAEVQALYVQRYGGGDTAPIDATEFAGAGGHFVMAYVDGVPAAMGGWRRHGDDAEIKRMFVREAYQRRGLARAVLAELECSAAKAGITRLVLETGLMQPEAIALYRSEGYEDIPAFGYYADDELSVHLGKNIDDSACVQVPGHIMANGGTMEATYDDREGSTS
jgi:GNAT superfamily N-acetyltransferase